MSIFSILLLLLSFLFPVGFKRPLPNTDINTSIIEDPLSSAQTTSRDVERLKQVDAIRNAMADYFTRYDATPYITPVFDEEVSSNFQYVLGSEKVLIGNNSNPSSTPITVTATNDYIFHIADGACWDASSGKDIYLYSTDTSVIYCNSNGQTTELVFKF